MKFGIRKPSLKRKIAARTSWKRYIRHSLGWKAPRGWGWLTNPKRAAYNRVYSRTSFDVLKLLKQITKLNKKFPILVKQQVPLASFPKKSSFVIKLLLILLVAAMLLSTILNT